MVRPFASLLGGQLNVTSGPLAYGRILASYTVRGRLVST